MRIGTANSYAKALDQLYLRQSDLASQQEKLSSGLNVNRASDDPTGTAQAERATAQISRIKTDQRALEVQRNAITSAESTLGEATSATQSLRDLVLTAGNASYSAADRVILAQQMASLRDQIFTMANRNDSNGVALFGGLGSTTTPFADAVGGVVYQGVPGQRSATTSAVPGAMDGQAIWMHIPSGNGTFEVGLAATNTGTAWTDAGTVTSPTSLTGDSYAINFTVTGTGTTAVTTYDVLDTTTGNTVSAGQPYKDGTSIQFDGMSVIVHGAPATGDAVNVAPSTQTNVFKVLDDAIAGINGVSGGNKLSQAVALSLVQIDSALERVQSARSQAGDWLNRADSITSAQGDRTIALKADNARAVELDPVKGISDFTMMNTGYQAALQSYAKIQSLSLFNFIN